MEEVLIFAGGESLEPALAEDLPRGDLVVAADSGYDMAVELGYRVDVLVGDFDSISTTDIPQHVIVERHPRDKEATDLELALELVNRESPTRIVVVGASGGRLDHELAVTGLLCSERWREIDIDWVSNRGIAFVIWNRRIIHGDVGATLTLIPVHGEATGVTTKGLRWELEDDRLPAGTTRGVSNVFESPVADIQVGSGCLLAVAVALSPEPGQD